MTRIKPKACQFFDDDGGSIGSISLGDGFDLYLIDRTDKVRKWPIGRAVAVKFALWIVGWWILSDWFGLRSWFDRRTLTRQLKRASRDDAKSKPAARVAWPGHGIR